MIVIPSSLIRRQPKTQKNAPTKKMDAAVVAVLVREGSPGATPATSKKKSDRSRLTLSLSVATLVFFSSFFFLFFVRGNADADRRRGAVIGLRRRWRFPFFFKYFSPSRTFASSNNGQQKWRPFWLEKSVAAASTGDVVGDVAKCGPDFFFKIFFKTLLQHSHLRFHRISTTTTIPPKKKEEKFQAMTGRFPTTALFKSTEKKEQHLHPSNVHHRLHVPFFVVFHQFSSPTRRSWSATFFFSLSSSLLLSVKKKMQRIIGETLIDRPRLWLTTTSLSIAGARVDVPKSVPKSADVTHTHTAEPPKLVDRK